MTLSMITPIDLQHTHTHTLFATDSGSTRQRQQVVYGVMMTGVLFQAALVVTHFTKLDSRFSAATMSMGGKQTCGGWLLLRHRRKQSRP